MSPAKGHSLHFSCPQCVTALKAPATLAGTRCRCPRCQFVFAVSQHSRKPPGETYALDQGNSPSMTIVPALIPVTCSVCQTRMLGGLDQVGQTLICPDCGTPAVVPSPPKAAIKHAGPPVANDIYPLCEEVASSPENPAADEQNLIRVMCPRCDTMMYATEDQIGGSLVCPDCRTSVVVPRPRPRRPAIDVMADAGEGYALADEQPKSSVPQAACGFAGIADRQQFSENMNPPAPIQTGRYFEPYFRRPRLPRWPFLAGTFGFPFSSNARAYTLLLAFWLATAFWMLSQTVILINDSDARSLFLGALFGAMTLISGVLLISYASACGLAVTRDTANSCDTISNWPGMAFIDWIGEPFYILNSLFGGLAPGVGLTWILMQYEQPGEAALPAVLFFLFPFFLLSTLETCSPFGLFSWAVFRTLWQAVWGWVVFYLETAALAGAAGIILVEAYSADILVGILIASLTLTIFWLVYFRLLGRLAWYCTDLLEKKAEHDSTE